MHARALTENGVRRPLLRIFPNHIYLLIVDNGHGMTEEHRKEVPALCVPIHTGI